ncbi:hypothetical protein LIER_12079 [Lithospermum erythrorhizon]|uniref:Integrase catalytic domain-containing protein n=1 Tax=Lithospermum erythrorhizon TaxID=34254 RepID=A0AAV3PRP9_LITER
MSLGGAKYFVSFIDDFSKRCWVYPIKRKADVFETFKAFKVRLELESGKKIKCLRIDNGGEYTSNEIVEFCKYACIKRQFTTAYTPQQNGVAEWMNKTLLERTRAILRATCLGKSFWAEAVNTACYLINRSPSTAIELKTPIEMWNGKKADYSNLHIFGSHLYAMYNDQERTKLDPKSKKCIYLEYVGGVKGYRLWDPTAHKFVISRNVIFLEYKLQEQRQYNIIKEEPETMIVKIIDEPNKKDSNPSEAELEHEVLDPDRIEPDAQDIRHSNHERRPLTWQSEYVMESNIAYYLLTEDGEPTTFQEAKSGSEASMWMSAMHEEIEALHKN